MFSALRIARTKQCSRSIANVALHNQGTIWAPDDHLPPITYHPRPHGIPAAMLHFRSHHLKLLEIFTFFATHAASALAIPISKPVFLPTQRSLWTVPRGPFVHKKSQENFERLVHKRAIKAWDADPMVIGTWIQYLEQYQLAGVGLRVVRWEHASIGFMNDSLKDIYDEAKSFRKLTDRAQIAALGQEIVEKEMDVAASVKEESEKTAGVKLESEEVSEVSVEVREEAAASGATQETAPR